MSDTRPLVAESVSSALQRHMALPLVANYSPGSVWWRLRFYNNLTAEVSVTHALCLIIPEHQHCQNLLPQFSCDLGLSGGVVRGICCPCAALCWPLSLAMASGWSVRVLLTHSGPGETAHCLWLHPAVAHLSCCEIESGRRADRWYYGNSSYQLEDLIKLQILCS